MDELLLIFFAFMLGGWVQGVLGFGFVVATTLLLINHMDFTILVFLNLSMSLLISLVAMLSAKNLKAVHKKTLLKLIISASAGLAIGIAMVSYVDARILKQVTLVSILVASLISLSKNNAFFSAPYISWIAGFISGILTPSTGINGPPVVLHLNAAFKDKARIRSTMLSYLLLIMAFGVISLSLQRSFAPETWKMLLKVAIPSIFGYTLGMLSFRLFSDLIFKRTVILFLIGSSLVSLIRLII